MPADDQARIQIQQIRSGDLQLIRRLDLSRTNHTECHMSASGKQSDVNLKDLNYIDVFQNFDEGIVIYDKQGKIVFYNKAQAEIDGLEQSEVIGRSMNELYQTDYEETPALRCIRDQQPIIGDTSQWRTRSGKQIYASRNIYPLYENNQFFGVVCFIREYGRISSNVEESHKLSRLAADKTGLKVSFRDIIGENPQFIQAIQTADQASKSVSAVMLVGESGTGKELFAQSIHNQGKREKKSFTAINCSAIPENLLEGILFGTSKGAFTGAIEKAGLFEQASGGTLFLDEINSMPTGLQAKMLRVIQEKKVRRVGSLDEIDIDLKIISSVNEDPEKEIEEGRLRRDLFYRLAVVLVDIPPLRDRPDDLPLLIPYFVARCNQKLSKNINTVSDDVANMFSHYHWPGNVRELEHIIEGTMNMVSGENTITRELLPSHFIKHFATELNHKSPELDRSISISSHQEFVTTQPGQAEAYPLQYQNRNLKETLAEAEAYIIRDMIKYCDGNAAKAAKNLGISRQLIYLKMKKLGIDHLKK